MVFGSKAIRFFLLLLFFVAFYIYKGHQAALWSRKVTAVLPNPFKNDLSVIDSWRM